LLDLPATIQAATGLEAARARWLVTTIALFLPWILLSIVDRIVRRPR
jgi:hypothetical protein